MSQPLLQFALGPDATADDRTLAVVMRVLARAGLPNDLWIAALLWRAISQSYSAGWLSVDESEAERIIAAVIGSRQ